MCPGAGETSNSGKEDFQTSHQLLYRTERRTPAAGRIVARYSVEIIVAEVLAECTTRNFAKLANLSAAPNHEIKTWRCFSALLEK